MASENTKPSPATAAEAEAPVKQIRISAPDRRKLEQIFEFFDKDHDEHLNSTELNNLQIATEGHGFENQAQYAFICKLLEMNPMKGINFAALARTYFDDRLPFESNLDADYVKLFPPPDDGGIE